MGNLFHGWRRKIGLVTLFIAGLFMAAWVRSYLPAAEDEITYPLSDGS